MSNHGAERSPSLGSLAPVKGDALYAYVQEALEHLYDYVLLQDHPLAAPAAATLADRNRAAALHRLLVEAIDGLKPPSGTPSHSYLWRRYRHAFLRYVEEASLADISEELGIGQRQLRRQNHEVVQAIASILRQRLGNVPGSAAAIGKARASGLDTQLKRIGAGESAGPTRLDEVLASVIDTVGNLAEARGARFVVRLPSGLPPTPVNRAAMRQILLGLVLWGLDMARPGTEVEIAAEASLGSVRLKVAAPSLQPGGRATAPASIEERVDITRKLAALQHGTLEQSTMDGRPALTLTLPESRQPTVLLVDDDTGMLRLLGRYLGGESCLVLEAQTGGEALRIAQERRPDAIILDVMMPDMDGWELLQSLRTQPSTWHIPVIMCSVLKERELALSLGATGFVGKPVTRDALLRALSALRLGQAE